MILAVGSIRGRRSALTGAVAGVLVLVVLVVGLGQSLLQAPLVAVRLLVGTLALLFGARWLRKAMLRVTGVIPRHDENTVFKMETAALRRATSSHDQLASRRDRLEAGAAMQIGNDCGVDIEIGCPPNNWCNTTPHGGQLAAAELPPPNLTLAKLRWREGGQEIFERSGSARRRQNPLAPQAFWVNYWPIAPEASCFMPIESLFFCLCVCFILLSAVGCFAIVPLAISVSDIVPLAC